MASLTAGKLLRPAVTASSARSISPFQLPFRFRSSPPSLRRLHKPTTTARGIVTARSSSTTVPVTSSTISVGDRLPDAALSYLDAAGEVQTLTVSDLTAGKKAVIFAVPGAFTPTCSQKHLPGSVEKAGELRSKGVDAIACVSVNDAFVMKAWKESLGVGDDVMLLLDGNGVELDLRDKPVGLGVRSRRYALLAEDGVVKVLNLEEGGSFTNSSAEDMLKAL